MCGIAGVVDRRGGPVDRAVVEAMTRALAHRGPDDEGVEIHENVGLGHRRLSIVDLSAAGHQPMASADGLLWLTYNGEVYNAAELRDELRGLGSEFRSRTDTEVVLRAWETWGRDCVHRFNGMFAFAVHDRRQRRLTLVRDRFGVKPLYYAVTAQHLLFASEVKAFLEHPGYSVRVCPQALNEYLTFQNVLSDRTLFQGVRLLPAGTMLEVALTEDGVSPPQRYWDFEFRPEEMSLEEASDEIYRCLKRGVERQLMSDVPVGSYLSGGIDSGSVTGLAAAHLPRIATFTGGFDLSSASGLELGFDERATSELLSYHFQTEHYEVVLKAGDMEAVMPDLSWHLEDLRLGQNYPNYYVSRLASRFVRVVLSGAGGDELFAGYPWRYLRTLQATSREQFLRLYYDYWQRLVTDEERRACLQPSVARDVEGHEPFDEFRRVFDGHDIEIGSLADCVNACLYFECKTFLHGFLVVEDKLSMAHGLETRVPFLDNDLVDVALRVPVAHKLANLTTDVVVDENEPGKLLKYDALNGDGKRVLRHALQRLAPKKVADLKKQGFSGPDASWFRGESLDYVQRLLLSDDARLHELIKPDFVQSKIGEHCSGQRNNRLIIWSFLSLEWWLRRFL